MLREGTVTSAELLEAFLARIDERNGAVNAVVVLDADAARARAAGLDSRKARGETLGPLHGLPLTIKNHPPASLPLGLDSELLITQLHEAGAVVFGYTNTPLAASDVQTCARFLLPSPLLRLPRWHSRLVAWQTMTSTAQPITLGI